MGASLAMPPVTGMPGSRSCTRATIMAITVHTTRMTRTIPIARTVMSLPVNRPQPSPLPMSDTSRRLFLGGLVAAPLMAQQAPRLVNDDQHGDVPMPRMAGMDAAGESLALKITMPGQVQPVLTRSGGNLRHGTYLQETALTPAAIQQTPLRKLFTMKMPGDPRIEAQPLLVPGITIADGTVHDLCICAGMSNLVSAFDANDGAMLWTVRLGNPVTGSRSIDMWFINPQWGILSTGVIDGSTLYVVAWSGRDGLPSTSQHFLHAIRLSDGATMRQPLALDQQSNIQRKQRAALTLATIAGRKTIFIPSGTIMETATGAHGYIVAVDVETWKITDELATTGGTGSGAGVWQAGEGLVVDDEGSLYCVASNGDYDGVANFGESLMKLAYDGTSLKVIDHWSPWKDRDRGTTGGYDDMDLGSAAPTVIRELNTALICGKDGVAYPAATRNMGHTGYSKLRSKPIWFTYYPAGKDAAPASPMGLNFLYANRSHHLHGRNVAFKSDAGWRVFGGGENGNVRAWSIDASSQLKFLGNGAEQSSPSSSVPPGGMPGFMMALSANGTKDALLWAACPDGDGNRTVTTGRLLCYDAMNLGKYSDGTGALKLLWQSERFTFNKFNMPVISGGRVYYATYDGQVLVYGL